MSYTDAIQNVAIITLGIVSITQGIRINLAARRK